MNEIDLAYTAGFIDGEGFVGVLRSGKSVTPQVVVSNTNTIPLQYLAGIWGGKVGPKFINEQQLASKKWKPQYRWQRYGLNAYELLKAIRPYLKVKSNQADLILDFSWSFGKGVKISEEENLERLKLKQSLHLLNRRGVE